MRRPKAIAVTAAAVAAAIAPPLVAYALDAKCDKFAVFCAPQAPDPEHPHLEYRTEMLGTGTQTYTSTSSSASRLVEDAWLPSVRSSAGSNLGMHAASETVWLGTDEEVIPAWRPDAEL